MDISTKFITQYNLAIKYYLHRNFSKSFELIYPLIKELKYNHKIINNENLRIKIIKLYFSLLSVLLNEIINHKVLDLSINNNSLHFINYLKFDNNLIIDEILNDFNKGGIYNFLNDIGLSNNTDLLLMCFMIESQNNLNFMELENQVENCLKNRGIYPGPINDNQILNDDDNVEKILQFYISQLILKNYGVERANNLIEKLFIIDNSSIIKWKEWLKKYQDEIMIANNKNSWDNNNQRHDYDEGVEEDDDEDDDDEDDDDFYENGYTSGDTIVGDNLIDSRSQSNKTNITNFTETTIVDGRYNHNSKLKVKDEQDKFKSKSKIKSKSKTKTKTNTKKNRNKGKNKQQKNIMTKFKTFGHFLGKYIYLIMILMLIIITKRSKYRLNLAKFYSKTIETIKMGVKIST